MDCTTPRTTFWKSTYVFVVISPAITTRPVAVSVSQATRLYGSSARHASKMASEIWSAILSGCPSVTDSEVKSKRFLADNWFLLAALWQFRVAGKSERYGHAFPAIPRDFWSLKRYQSTSWGAISLGQRGVTPVQM